VAARGDLKPGDIITSFAGKRVRTMAALDQMVETLKPGDKATAKFIRDGENQSIVLQF
jgi:serine protease Do